MLEQHKKISRVSISRAVEGRAEMHRIPFFTLVFFLPIFLFITFSSFLPIFLSFLTFLFLSSSHFLLVSTSSFSARAARDAQCNEATHWVSRCTESRPHLTSFAAAPAALRRPTPFSAVVPLPRPPRQPVRNFLSLAFHGNGCSGLNQHHAKDTRKEKKNTNSEEKSTKKYKF